MTRVAQTSKAPRARTVARSVNLLPVAVLGAGASSANPRDHCDARLPHYWLGAFFVLAHLAAGARSVIMAHGVSKTFADRFMISGTVVAAIIATWIILGMSGMRVQFV